MELSLVMEKGNNLYMGCEHKLGNVSVKYVPIVDRFFVKVENGTSFYTNDFSVVREYVSKKLNNEQLTLKI